MLSDVRAGGGRGVFNRRCRDQCRSNANKRCNSWPRDCEWLELVRPPPAGSSLQSPCPRLARHSGPSSQSQHSLCYLRPWSRPKPSLNNWAASLWGISAAWFWDISGVAQPIVARRSMWRI